MFKKLTQLMGMALLCAVWVIPAAASSFYQGKTLTIVVSSSAGGGHDQWARLVAPYLKKYLRLAEVKVIDQPGGGGLIADNAVYKDKANGLTIEVAKPGAVFAQMFNNPDVHYDASRWTVFGAVNYAPYLFLAHHYGPYKTFTDLRNTHRTVVALATGRGSTSYQIPNIVLSAFGIPHKMVSGFKGQHGLVGTFLTGNGDMFGTTPHRLKSLGARARALIFISNKALKGYSEVPTLLQEANKAGLKGSKKTAMIALSNLMFTDVWFVGPPGVPASRVYAVEAAFRRATKSQSFRTKAKNENFLVQYTSGAKLRNAFLSMLKYKTEFRRLNK